MGNCAQQRDQNSNIEAKLQKGMKSFLPTFDANVSPEQLAQSQSLKFKEMSLNYNENDYFDRQFAISQAQEFKNILKIQRIRLPHFTQKQLIIEIGYGINFPQLNTLIRITGYPNKSLSYLSHPSDNQGHFFEIVNCKEEIHFEEIEFILFELVQNGFVVSYSQVPVVCLLNQKVQELNLEFMSPLQLQEFYDQKQVKPLKSHDHKLWIRIQYLYNLEELQIQQEKELQAFRMIYDI